MLLLWILTDEEAHERILHIYRRYHDDMIRFARGRLRRLGDANYLADSEDIVQNAFVKITKYIDSIDMERSEKEVRVYILSIVVNEINTFFAKKEAIADPEDIEGSEDDFFEKLQLREQYQSVLEAMRSLDIKYVTVLWYKYYKNYDVGHIAALLGITEKAVYTRILRAKKMLLERLGKEKR